MIDTIEIADGIYRISMSAEPDLVAAGLVLPASYNLFVIASEEPVLINTMMRRSFDRLRPRVGGGGDPTRLRYLVVSHHEADTDGAINDWLALAARAEPVATELCAVLSLRDLSDRAVRVVADGELLDLGSHRLRFLHTPYVNQWDSMMVHEEQTGTLFPNDLFASPVDSNIIDSDPTEGCLAAAREFGYMANDRACLDAALDKVQAAAPARIAPMHGPVLTAHLDKLVNAFRENSLAPTH